MFSLPLLKVNMKKGQVEFGTSVIRIKDRFIQFLIMLALTCLFRLCQLLYQVKIVGEENIPATGPCLLVGNHSSKMDFFAFAFTKKKRPDAYVYGSGLRAQTAPFMRALGVIPVFRGTGIASSPLIWMILKALQNGRAILNTPEGEMEWDGRLSQPLKSGAAWLALNSGAPIVICMLRGGYSIWPRWAKFPKLKGNLELRIGKPFSILQSSMDAVNQVMIQDVNQRIAEEMRRLEAEP